MAIIKFDTPNPLQQLNQQLNLDPLQTQLNGALQLYNPAIQETVAKVAGAITRDAKANIPITTETVSTPTLPPVATENVPIEPGPVCVLVPEVGERVQALTNPVVSRTDELTSFIEDRASKFGEIPVVKAANNLARAGVKSLTAALGIDAVDKANATADLVKKKEESTNKTAREIALAVNQENPSLANSENRVNQLSKYYGTEMGMHNASLASIGKSLGDIISTILSIPGKIINALLSAVRDVINAVTSGIKALIAPVLAVFETALGGVLNLVGSTIKGLVNGMLGPITSVTSAVKGEIDAVTQALKRYLSGPVKQTPSNADPSFKSVTANTQEKAINNNSKVVPIVVSADGTREIITPPEPAQSSVGGVGQGGGGSG